MSAAYPFALGDTAGECAMFEEAFTPCSSQLPLAPGARRFFPYLLWKKQCTVRQRTLDDVLEGRSFQRPALLKIDVQGMEDRVLKGASRVLHDIDVILVETSFVRINEGQLLFPEMRSLIESYGFRYQGSALQWKSFFGGRIIQEDSVFVR
jgi:hypothetical protein